jgi:CheY-like chemotaxis protein
MSSPAAKYRVLVVDDNRDAADSMSDLLARAGFAVETCYDGPAALAAAGRDRPDACLLDINMPGMDGYTLARQLRDLSPGRPPVFATMTAYEDYAHLEKAADAGFDLQFTKPADPAEVARELEDHIRRGTTFAAAAEAEGPAPGGDEPGAVRRLLSRFFGLWSKPR